MDNWMQVAGCAYSQEEAQLVLAGYCFGTREVPRKAPRDHRGGRVQPFLATDPLPAVQWFGYATYDCIDASEGPVLGPVDLLVPAGLNGRLDVAVMTGLLAVERQVSDALAVQAAHGDLAFWELDPGELKDLDLRVSDLGPAERPQAASRLEGLYRAWWLLMSTPHVGAAVTHKLLHHKLPRLAPLLDGRTGPILSRQRVALDCSSSWAVILDDLTRQAGQFESLESFQAALAGPRETQALFRLRIHDILLWCEATRQRGHAQRLGEEIRRQSGNEWPEVGLPAPPENRFQNAR
jgi:hypothetical protein